MESGAVGNFALSEVGREYFENRFIRDDHGSALAILQKQLESYGPAAALVQSLSGMPSADRRRTESVLRSQGLDEGLNNRRLGTLLMLLDTARLIDYSKNAGTLSVLIKPAERPDVPQSIFVAPETPFGNRAWLRRVIATCESHLWWLDKHFMPGALEVLWESLDGGKVSDVRVLSLKLPEHETKAALRAGRNLRLELQHRGISFEWRRIDSGLIRTTHDRWIIGANRAWNVPNVNAILSGQHSEMHEAPHRDEIEQLFTRYWQIAEPLHG